MISSFITIKLLLYVSHSVYHPLHIRHGGVNANACPDGSRKPQRLVKRHSAVCSRPYANSLFCQKIRHIMGMDPLRIKGHNPILRLPRSQDMDSLERLQTFRKPPAQSLRMAAQRCR